MALDSQTRKDAEQIIKSMVRTTVKYPDVAARHHGKMVYNERSLYMVPGTRRLVNLLRGQYAPKNLSASTCTLPYDPRAVPLKPNPTSFSCRPGVGDAFMNLVELVKDWHRLEQDLMRKDVSTPVWRAVLCCLRRQVVAVEQLRR